MVVWECFGGDNGVFGFVFCVVERDVGVECVVGVCWSGCVGE